MKFWNCLFVVNAKSNNNIIFMILDDNINGYIVVITMKNRNSHFMQILKLVYMPNLIQAREFIFYLYSNCCRIACICGAFVRVPMNFVKTCRQVTRCHEKNEFREPGQMESNRAHDRKKNLLSLPSIVFCKNLPELCDQANIICTIGRLTDLLPFISIACLHDTKRIIFELYCRVMLVCSAHIDKQLICILYCASQLLACLHRVSHSVELCPFHSSLTRTFFFAFSHSEESLNYRE